MSKMLVISVLVIFWRAVSAGTPAGDGGATAHIELNFLDRDVKIYIADPVDWAVTVRPPLKYADFRLGEHRHVYVLVGRGGAHVGSHLAIDASDEMLQINGYVLRNARSAVVQRDGTVVPGAFIRTFD